MIVTVRRVHHFSLLQLGERLPHHLCEDRLRGNRWELSVTLETLKDDALRSVLCVRRAGYLRFAGLSDSQLNRNSTRDTSKGFSICTFLCVLSL